MCLYKRVQHPGDSTFYCTSSNTRQGSLLVLALAPNRRHRVGNNTCHVSNAYHSAPEVSRCTCIMQLPWDMSCTTHYHRCWVVGPIALHSCCCGAIAPSCCTASLTWCLRLLLDTGTALHCVFNNAATIYTIWLGGNPTLFTPHT